MKYQNLRLFRKYLEEALKERLSSIFLVMNPSSFERAKIMKQITTYLPNRHAFSHTHFSAKEIPVDRVIHEMRAPSLFGGEPLIIFDDIEALNKAQIQDLCSFFTQSQSLFGYLICGSKTKLPNSSDFDKCGVVLDLLGEKFWEKEKRFAEYIVEKCAQNKKTISKEAIEQFILQVGIDDLSIIDQEIVKVITYVGKKEKVEKEDIIQIVMSDHQYNLWQLAEEIVWDLKNKRINTMQSTIRETSFFLSLLASIRYQLQLGAKLASLQNISAEEKREIDLPRMHPKLFEKRKIVAQNRGEKFFQKALSHLFDMEVLSKNQSYYPLALIELFLSKTKCS